MLIALKPKSKDVPVRKQNGDFLSLNGEKVERNSYWVRRLNDGDVDLLKGDDLEKYQALLAKQAKAEAKQKAQVDQDSESKGE